MTTRALFITRALLAAIFVFAAAFPAASGQNIPAAWSDRSMTGYRLPLAATGEPPRMISGDGYYALPEYNLKTYPVYAPGHEPAGYIEWLKEQDPAPLVDIGKLRTREDWIKAGREVFYGRELPRFSGSEDNYQLVRDPRVVAAYGLQISKDGILLGLRYVVRQKGKIELGTDTCAMCHTQVRSDGTVIEGPPNVHTPFGPLMGDLTRRYARISPAFLKERRIDHMREDYRAPFLHPDPSETITNLPAEQIASLYDRIPLGVYARTNTSLEWPVKIANLIGIRDMKFFDRTGTARNRGIADLMKYCGSIADVSDALTEYASGPEGRLNLAHMGLGAGIRRTPDPLLYALALYVESLEPPANPNPVDAKAEHGREIFTRQGCAGCHTPPLYTNNRLTLAQGYQPPAPIIRETGVMEISVGTDPNLALKTRKGTGFYRVPSLRMIWLDRAFLHDGSVGSLEELFDPARLRPEFHSSNWPAATPPHAVNGHPFGLSLNATDRDALVAFLKTL